MYKYDPYTACSAVCDPAPADTCGKRCGARSRSHDGPGPSVVPCATPHRQNCAKRCGEGSRSHDGPGRLDPAFARAFYAEAVTAILNGETAVGLSQLRDIDYALRLKPYEA